MQSGPLDLDVEAGPDSGSRHALSIGRHHLGRSAACAVVLADPAVEPHHAVLDVASGRCVLTQLTGRWPILVDGLPVSHGVLALGAAIEIGDSRLVVRHAGEPPDVAVGGSPLTVRLGCAISPAVPDRDLDAWSAPASSHGEAVVAELGGPDRVVVAIRGEGARSAVRSIVAQLANRSDPMECRIVPVLADRREAEWMERLPRASGRTVVVADRVAALRSGAVADLVGGAPATVIVTVPADRAVPPEATALLQLGPRWRGTWIPDTSATGPATSTRLHIAGRTAR